MNDEKHVGYITREIYDHRVQEALKAAYSQIAGTADSRPDSFFASLIDFTVEVTLKHEASSQVEITVDRS